MMKILRAFGLLSSILTLMVTSCGPKNAGEFRIVIASITEIGPIRELREGFRERIESSEFGKTHKLVFDDLNALGDASLMSQISDKIAVASPDLVYVLGTPFAQMIQKKSPNVLLVQGACTDPVAAGLANSWDGSGRNYIATSDLPPVDRQIDLIVQLVPGATRIGVLYNPGESNSVSVISRVRDYLSKNAPSLSLVERSVSATAEAAVAVQSLNKQVDAIFLPPDNTVHSAIAVILKFARENRIPVFATTGDALNQGAVASLSLDFKELGRESADMALQVLNGADPATMPIRLSSRPTISINEAVAKELNLNIERFEKWKDVKIVAGGR